MSLRTKKFLIVFGITAILFVINQLLLRTYTREGNRLEEIDWNELLDQAQNRITKENSK